MSAGSPSSPSSGSEKLVFTKCLKLNLLVVEPTQLKNFAVVKLNHFPGYSRGKNQKNFETNIEVLYLSCNSLFSGPLNVGKKLRIPSHRIVIENLYCNLSLDPRMM